MTLLIAGVYCLITFFSGPNSNPCNISNEEHNPFKLIMSSSISSTQVKSGSGQVDYLIDAIHCGICDRILFYHESALKDTPYWRFCSFEGWKRNLAKVKVSWRPAVPRRVGQGTSSIKTAAGCTVKFMHWIIKERSSSSPALEFGCCLLWHAQSQVSGPMSFR